MNHFPEYELICKHCGKSDFQESMLTILNLVRHDYGKPINLNSAYRCPKHPESIKNPTSSHIKGQAVDIKCTNSADRWRLIALFKLYGIRRFGVAKNFIHVDNDANKTQNVMWVY